MSLLPKEIEAYYQQSKESERLSNAWGELERLRTQALLARHLPSAPAVIFDVGGGAGVYALPLAKQGYEVHLIDAVELHLEQARTSAAECGVALASITQGDARHLEVPSGFADAVLLLGPLYHLVERSDRLKALRESRRILKPRGVLLAASICRFASLIDGLSRGFFRDAEFRKIVAADLTSGQHCNPTKELDYFTTAYFHRPEELAAEVSDAGFDEVQLLSIEGPAERLGVMRHNERISWIFYHRSSANLHFTVPVHTSWRRLAGLIRTLIKTLLAMWIPAPALVQSIGLGGSRNLWLLSCVKAAKTGDCQSTCLKTSNNSVVL